MWELGITDYRDIYDHPKFTPQEVFKRIKERARPYGGDSLLRTVPTILDINDVERIGRQALGGNPSRCFELLDMIRN